MSKITYIITILLIIPLLSLSQSWTNYNSGYKKHYSLAMTDSLIFVGGEQIINVYNYDGTHKLTKLTDGSNYSSCIDKNGVISFNNKYDILQFDGQQWKKIRPSIPDNFECTSVACDNDNNLWATFANTQENSAFISKFDGYEWTNINSFADSISLTFANEIVIDTNNVVYAGITVIGNGWTHGVARIDQNDTTIFHNWNSNCSIGFRVSSHLDWRNHVWFGGNQNELIRFDGTEWHNEGDDPILVGKSFSSIYLDENDDLWLGSSNALYVQSDGVWSVYTENNNLLFDYIWDIKPDSNKNIWLAASPNLNHSVSNQKNGNLTKFDSNSFSHYQPNTLKGESQKVMFKDDEVWVLGNYGFSILKDVNCYINDINASIPYEEIIDFTIDYYDNVWMISKNALYKLKSNNTLEQFTTIQGITFQDNTSISSYIDNIWISSTPYILKYDGGFWSTANIEESLSPSLNTIVPTNDVTIYTGSTEGAIRIGCCSITIYTEENGLVDNNVNDITLEGYKVWFATAGGLSEFDGTDYINYVQDSADFDNYNKYSSIHIDKNEHKWVGSLMGLYKFDNYNFHFLQPNGIDEPINYITEDNENNLWVAGKYGLSKYTFAPTDIQFPENEINEFSIFPNPTSGQLYIAIENHMQNDIAEIYSIDGKLVYSQAIQNGLNNINTNSFISGIYILRLKNSGKSKQFIVE